MTKQFIPKIFVFHCITSLPDLDDLSFSDDCRCELKSVKLACSSMVKDVFLLKAFEHGADAVLVLVCPEGTCRYVEGNLRAKKRVDLIKKLLDDIGLDGKRISLHSINHNNAETASQVVETFAHKVFELGPAPTAA